MAKGDGSITEVRRGVWRVRIDWGKDPLTGKRVVQSRNVRGSKADARKVRDQMRKEHESGLKAEGASTTFGEFAKEWLEGRERSKQFAEATLKSNGYEVSLLSSIMGHIRLADIDAQTAEKALTLIKEQRKVSNTTIRKTYITLNQIMSKAVVYDLILRNPCDKIKPPRVDKVNRKSLSASEYARLVQLLETETTQRKEEYLTKEARQTEIKADCRRNGISGIREISDFVAARIAVATGMRLGEVLGLNWGSVNLPEGTLEVKQALTASGHLKEPKSISGHRIIALDRATVDYLYSWKVFQSEQFGKIGVKTNDETPVCCSNACSFINLANFGHRWRSWADSHGFDGLKFHELRHTQATQLLASGVDVKTVQSRLGHASASLTLDLYAHALPEKDREAADIMAKLATTSEQKKGRIIDLKTA